MTLPESVYAIPGFLDSAEADLLYSLASKVSKDSTIVEIGSYQGKSTVALGLGAKVSEARMYAIDPHEECQPNETTHYGMENHAALLKNLVEFGVADVVRVVAMPSFDVWRAEYHWEIKLLWIDGSHDYRLVKTDLNLWSKRMQKYGLIAIHDTSGHFPDVSRALDEFLAQGEWVVDERVAATTVLKRI